MGEEWGAGKALHSKIFHYNNGFLHEFVDKNFQL